MPRRPPPGGSPDRVELQPLGEIRRLYDNTTKGTIQKDLARAIELLKTMPTEEERERAAVYMDGLAEMRREWASGLGIVAAPEAGAPLVTRHCRYLSIVARVTRMLAVCPTRPSSLAGRPLIDQRITPAFPTCSETSCPGWSSRLSPAFRIC